VTPKVLIIGYGNPLRGDDGVGWYAAQHLFNGFSDERVEVLACQQLTPELAERIGQAEMVIFIDASTGSSPGRISCSTIELQTARSVELMHHIEPSVLMDCSRRLYDSNPKAFLLSVCGESFDLGEGLTRAVSSALPEVVRKVSQLASLHELHGRRGMEVVTISTS
jgi:hydrogenase maturation protease